MKHSRCIPSVLSPWEEDHATAYCRHYCTVTVVSFLDPPGYFVWCQFYYCISSRTALRCCLPFTHERGADRPVMHESLCSQKNVRGLLVSIPPLLVGGGGGRALTIVLLVVDWG